LIFDTAYLGGDVERVHFGVGARLRRLNGLMREHGRIHRDGLTQPAGAISLQIQQDGGVEKRGREREKRRRRRRRRRQDRDSRADGLVRPAFELVPRLGVGEKGVADDGRARRRERRRGGHLESVVDVGGRVELGGGWRWR